MDALRDFISGSRRNYAIAVSSTVLLIAIAVSLATGIIGGNGSPKSFTAQSFVDAANDQGAGLVLGSKLISSQKDVAIYGISFQASDTSPAKPQDEHGGASLTISPDSDAAIGVYQQCESAGNFICYRANNASLVFDQGTDPHGIARVDGAVRAMAGN